MVETRVTCGTPTRWEFFCIDCVTSMESVFSASSFWEAPRSAEVWFVHVKVNASHQLSTNSVDAIVRLTLQQVSSLKNASFHCVPNSCMSCGSSSRENSGTSCGNIKKNTPSRPHRLMAHADTSCTDGRTVRENVCVCSFLFFWHVSFLTIFAVLAQFTDTPIVSSLSLQCNAHFDRDGLPFFLPEAPLRRQGQRQGQRHGGCEYLHPGSGGRRCQHGRRKKGSEDCSRDAA